MSNERRRQRKRERQRARRAQASRRQESVGTVHAPGIWGFIQRRQRVVFTAMALVMIASLGGGFFATQLRASSPSPTPTPTATATDEPTETATATETSTASATETETATATATETATEVATTTIETPDEIVRSYSEPPPFTIDTSASYEALIHTEVGDIRIELLPEAAPGYVNNFVFLARNRFYDGLTFHRVVPGFVAQAGDPTATSAGGAGYTIEEESNDILFAAGALSMAKGANGVDGSQFFITLASQPTLKDGGFTVFGRVTEGFDVLQALTPRDPQLPDQPPGDRILSIEIIEG